MQQTSVSYYPQNSPSWLQVQCFGALGGLQAVHYFVRDWGTDQGHEGWVESQDKLGQGARKSSEEWQAKSKSWDITHKTEARSKLSLQGGRSSRVEQRSKLEGPAKQSRIRFSFVVQTLPVLAQGFICRKWRVSWSQWQGVVGERGMARLCKRLHTSLGHCGWLITGSQAELTNCAARLRSQV